MALGRAGPGLGTGRRDLGLGSGTESPPAMKHQASIERKASRYQGIMVARYQGIKVSPRYQGRKLWGGVGQEWVKAVGELNHAAG